MNRAAQALLLTAIGALALRVGWTDEHVRYVNESMRWPLIVSGLLLVALACTAVIGKRATEDHPASRATWALLIPLVIGFVVQPPALGSYVAERRVNQVSSDAFDDPAVAPLRDGAVSELQVSNFVVLAASHPDVLEGHEVRLTGFVTSDDDGWYVTRVAIRCCAADATAFRARVEGQDPPADDKWVRVTGSWVEGSGSGDADPVLEATELTEIDEPKFPYE